MKKRKNLYYSEGAIDYVAEYQSEHHLKNFTSAVEAIIDEHKHRSDIDTTDIVIKEIAKQVAEKLSDTLTRIRLGANNADRNSDIILMLLNTLLSYQPLSTLITEETPQLAKARQIEKDRIAHFRQKKLTMKRKKRSALKRKSRGPHLNPCLQMMMLFCKKDVMQYA